MSCASLAAVIFFESRMIQEKRKSIIITGASRGLGFALTKQFISKQWNVVPLVRQDKDAIALNNINAAQCFPIIADVTDNEVQSTIHKSIASFKELNVLINNAGIGGTSADLNGTTPEEVLALIDVHCLGALRVTKAVLPFMKKNGIIINVSSRFGSIKKISTGELDDINCSYSYRIAKAAQNMLTQCMCREFKSSSLRICSVHPGQLKTKSASSDADKTPEEAAKILFEMLNKIEHGRFYSLFEETIEW